MAWSCFNPVASRCDPERHRARKYVPGRNPGPFALAVGAGHGGCNNRSSLGANLNPLSQRKCQGDLPATREYSAKPIT